jgi:hypothetical protein
MLLFGIEPEKPGFELRSFDCPKCHHIGVETGKTRLTPTADKLLNE